MKIDECRFCNGKLRLILSLGDLPIPNFFPDKFEKKSEKKYPLELYICSNCGLGQLGLIVSPKVIFKDYHYLSGASKPLENHLRKLAKECMKISSGNKILEIGSNDGTMLSEFKKNGWKSLGIDPSEHAVNISRKKGIPSVNKFFNNKAAISIKEKYGKFDLIIFTHTLANIVDIKDYMNGVRKLISSDGLVVLEVGDFNEMIKSTKFDSIYHEHYSYFSLETLKFILESSGFKIVKHSKNSFHGGSVRIFARLDSGNEFDPHKFPKRTIKWEEYDDFADRIRKLREDIKKIFEEIEDEKIIVGWGAPAKAVTLLNYCDIPKDRISCILDSTLNKQNRFLPGVGIPVYPESYISDKKVDYFFILAWNYKKDILKKIKNKNMNTEIIIPFPKLKIFSA